VLDKDRAVLEARHDVFFDNNQFHESPSRMEPTLGTATAARLLATSQ
jgi:hypothetical protein